MPDRPVRILLVGHCSPDAYAIRSAVSSMIPGAAIEFVQDQSEIGKRSAGADLLLINRALDGNFAEENGVELIRGLASGGSSAPKVMLVSGFPDAQTAAEAAGAKPGFGKRDLYSPETKRRLRVALGLD